jgi:hypothetical protein
MRGFAKAANERKYPHVGERAVASDGLNVKLNRQIVQFHKSRHIRPRHGRTIVSDLYSFIAGASKIYRTRATLSNSLAESSVTLAFEVRPKTPPT